VKKTGLLLIILSLLFCTGADFTDIEKAAENEFGISFSESVENIKNDGKLPDAVDIWEKIKSTFYGAVKESLVTFTTVFSVVVFFSVISAMQHGMGSGGISEVAFFSVYGIVSVLLLRDFSAFYKIALSLSDSITLFLNSAIPIIGTTMVSCGGFGVYTAMTPVIMIASSVSVNLIKTVAFPAVMMSLSLSLVGSMSKEFSLIGAGKTIRSVVLWVVTGVLSIFCALIGISGIGAGGFNVVLMRGVKMVASSMIPVLGSVLSESAEAVMTGGVILKNAIGSVAMLCMVLMIIYPLLKIGAAILVYKVLSAVISPFCDSRICGFVSEVSGVLSCFLGFICAQAVVSAVAMLSLISFKGVL